ncbi:MAG: TonB-dependent receptor [Acidobacteriaceae bacterium]
MRDSSGQPVIGARIVADSPDGRAATISDRLGHFELEYTRQPHTLSVRAMAPGQESDIVQTNLDKLDTEVLLTVHPTPLSEQITVTATRSSLDLPQTPSTIYAISSDNLQNYPATALDDKLRQHAGFELFRRASSNVANPTSQGISLRGLGSTAASRTLVLETGVPMNDPFGGWIHWNTIPKKALDSVDLASGGGSDLYGSSALGGVIDVIPARPTTGRFGASAFGGGQDTSMLALRGDIGSRNWRQLVAGDSFRTAGYVPLNPTAAGPVDTPSTLKYQNLRVETDHVAGVTQRSFLLGNLLNEARNNGTHLQTNGTRLWRYIAGDDWTAGRRASGRARLFGSDEAYRQSFSSINASRTTENLTRLQKVRTQELGASADASVVAAPAAFVTGFDVRDIRATDNETPISLGVPNGVANTSSRQRFVGGFGELLANRGRWSAALSIRLDGTSNFDTRSIVRPSTVVQPTATPDRSEFIASPRFGIVRAIGSSAGVHASVFRAFRTPTMNELYRTGQVGQQITQANALLQSERATGFEAGTSYNTPSGWLALQATYFWTEINRPVSAVLISSMPTSTLEKRQNLGQIISQGTELHLDIRPHGAFSGSLGYQYAHAVVTRFSAQPSLIGNWIPQVPRQSFAGQMRAQNAGFGEIVLAARASGQAFDDSANKSMLRAFFQLDLFARHDFGTHWSLSTTVQNLLNQRPDVARTPTLTLGSPLLAQGGIDFHWTRSSVK